MMIRYTELGIRLGGSEKGVKFPVLVCPLKKGVKISRKSRVVFNLQKKANRLIFETFSESLQNRSKSFNVMECYFSDADNCL